MSSLNRYLGLVFNYLNDHRGNQLASFLSLSDSHIRSRWIDDLEYTLEDAIEESDLREPWNQMLIEHLGVCYALRIKKIEEAYRAQAALTKLFSDEFRTHKERNWALPVLRVVSRDLRLLAKKADQFRISTDHLTKYERLEEAANILNEAFRTLSSDVRSDVYNTKRLGVLYVCNQLFKIYYYIGRTGMCVSLHKAVQVLPISIWSEFTLAQKVTYNFYAGLTCLEDSKNNEAVLLLTFAFEHCPRSSYKNKRLIAIFLTVARLKLGYLPKLYILKKYRITEYENIARSLRTGDVSLFHSTTTTYRRVFEEWKVYWHILNLLPLVHRTLFKRVWLICGGNPGPFNLSDLTLGLKVAKSFRPQNGEDEWSNDEKFIGSEVEGYLCQLISDGLVKGYVSHSHKKVVLSKAGDAFTSLPIRAP